VTVARFLFATWDGGGTLAPELSVARALAARGHDVRVLADRALAADVARAELDHAPWTTAPQRSDASPRHAVVRDWEARTPPRQLRRAIDGIWCGPAGAYADDVRAELRRWPADALVSSGMLFGAQVGGRAEGVPTVSLQPNPMPLPGWGVPPIGPGWRPRPGLAGRLRDALGSVMARRLFDHGLPALNAARTAHGLAPLATVLEQFTDVDRMLILTSAALEYPGFAPPAHVRITGPRLDDPPWAAGAPVPGGAEPLVLVALSSTYMAQEPVLARVAAALGTLPVRGLVTTGPAVDPARVPAPANVTVVRAASHAAVLPQAAAVVTHAGHGTLIRALAAGVPAVCMPMGRDQHENAARAVAAGAAVRLRASASPDRIAGAVRDVLTRPAYRAAAARMAAAIREEVARDRALAEIEALVGVVTQPTPA